MEFYVTNNKINQMERQRDRQSEDRDRDVDRHRMSKKVLRNASLHKVVCLGNAD